jgi:phenylacetate-CoA ligase
MEVEDPRERRDPEERERALMKALPRVVADVFARAPVYRRRDPTVVPEEIVDRRALATLRVVRKSELAEIQRADPPFGGLSATAAPRGGEALLLPGRCSSSSPERGPWRGRGRCRAAGFRAGDVVHNSFSYHLTPQARWWRRRRMPWAAR